MREKKYEAGKNLQATPIPQSGFLRLKQIIIGDPKASPPIPPIIPVSKSTWWAGVADGRYPSPVRLSARTVGWCVSDIRALIVKLEGGEAR